VAQAKIAYERVLQIDPNVSSRSNRTHVPEIDRSIRSRRSEEIFTPKRRVDSRV